MNRIRKILVSVDATRIDVAPHALVRAKRLSKCTGAELRLADVVQRPSMFVRKLFHGATAADDLLTAERQRNLNTLCEQIRKSGIPCSAVVLQGRPFVELIREVERQSCDLLIRDASGNGETSSFLLGSVDMRLMRNCPCPVWIVKPRPVMQCERILAAIDPFPEGEEQEQLNERILQLAASLADWEHGALYAVGAWDVRGEPLLMSKMNSTAFEDHVEDIRLWGRETFLQALESLSKPLVPSHAKYERGEAADVIVRSAEDINADVIVMGTLARTGVPGMLIGNIAERVLRQARCSILTIKPQRFVSPVLAETLPESNPNRETSST